MRHALVTVLNRRLLLRLLVLAGVAGAALAVRLRAVRRAAFMRMVRRVLLLRLRVFAMGLLL